MIRAMRYRETRAICRLLYRCGFPKKIGYLPADNGPDKTLVYVHDKRLVATLGIRDGNRICYLGVSPRFRGMGIARELLRSLQISNPYLFVRMWNYKAINLYLSEGYRICGRRKFSFKMRKETKNVRTSIGHPDGSINPC